jgi:photosystem II stability/assembly factor-like uncharacterized protein
LIDAIRPALRITRRVEPPQGHIRAMRFANPHTGWAVTSEGLLTTSDGGRSWRPNVLGQFTERYVFPRTIALPNHKNHWLLCSYLSREERCLRSHDSGNSWQEAGRFFAERGHFIFGGTLVHKTEDGGDHWAPTPFKVLGYAQKLLFC